MYSLFTNVQIQINLLFAHPFQRTLTRDREYTPIQRHVYYRESSLSSASSATAFIELGQQANNRPINKHVSAGLWAKAKPPHSLPPTVAKATVLGNRNE